GVRAARIAAGHGARVAIAEEYRIGGTCVIRGCVPKKLLVYASRFADDFEDAAGFGWTVGPRSFDWATLIRNKDREIDRLSAIYARNLEASGVTTFTSRAEFVDRHTLRLKADGRTVTAHRVLVATGGRPFVPDIPGAQHAITSNEAFHLPALPKSLVVVGGGYIAVEFAGIFAGLGAAVTLVYRGTQILRGFDDDMRDGLAEEMVRRGIDIVVETDVTGIAPDGAGRFVARLGNGREIAADQVMYATGRVPHTTGLGLEAAGVERGWNGHVVVDEQQRTNVDTIYAVGDVCDRVNLTPVAIREGHAFADSVYGQRPWQIDHDMIPTAVFSTPEIGTVGWTEAEAREKCAHVDIYKARFRPMRHTLSGREERMVMKLIVDAESDRVVGCHILGPDAGEIVQMAAIAMRMGATKAQFDSTMALHPSAAEELVTMRQKWQPPAA
ncbi:MAG: glutathione-disulfide reductase, partial [Hyphomicrobiaceae bacterium]|nr:glutathione-disulfide reductase [Hyphomicrobiaceae bacterium]